MTGDLTSELLVAIIALPLAGAAIARWLRPDVSWRVAMTVVAVDLALAVSLVPAFYAARPTGAALVALSIGDRPLIALDELAILLIPFVAVVVALTTLVVPRAQRSAGFCARVLASDAIVLATFSTGDRLALTGLWAAAMVPAALEMRAAGAGGARAVRGYFALSVLCFVASTALLEWGPASGDAQAAAAALLLVAILVRKGIVPFHSWMPELFDRVPLATAVLFSVPQLGAYVLVRSPVLGLTPATLTALGTLALVTAVYAAGVGLVQRDARRAVAWLFMSESALVLAGFESRSVAGVAGGLSLWISSGLSLGGFILTLWVLEARRGRLALDRYHGGHERMPMLAASFLVLGLASVGLPGTLGFLSEELLNEGAVLGYPQIGVGAVLAATFNAITVLRLYFVLFCGRRDPSTTLQRLRRREAIGFTALVALLVAGGVWSAPIVDSRARAARAYLATVREGGDPHAPGSAGGVR